MRRRITNDQRTGIVANRREDEECNGRIDLFDHFEECFCVSMDVRVETIVKEDHHPGGNRDQEFGSVKSIEQLADLCCR